MISQHILIPLINHASINKKARASWVIKTSMGSLDIFLWLWSSDWVKSRSLIVHGRKTFIFDAISRRKLAWLDIEDILLGRRFVVGVVDCPQESAAHGVHVHLLEEVTLLSLGNHLLVLEVVKVLLHNALISVW